MGLSVIQKGTRVEERRSDLIAKTGRELSQYAPFQALFPNVSRIEAIFAGVDRQKQTTLYVLDDRKKIHKQNLDEATADPKIWQAAQLILGKQTQAPHFRNDSSSSDAGLQTDSLAEEETTPPDDRRIERESSARSAPPKEEKEAPSTPRTEESEGPNPLEERVAQLEERLRKEEEELTQTRQSTDTLKTDLRDLRGDHNKAKASAEAWQGKAVRLFQKDRARLKEVKRRLAQLERTLAQRTEALRLLNQHRLEQAALTGRLEGANQDSAAVQGAQQERIAALEQRVQQLVDGARALVEGGVLQLPPAGGAPRADRGPLAAEPPPPADERVNELYDELPRLRADIANLQRALEGVGGNEERMTDLIFDSSAAIEQLEVRIGALQEELAARANQEGRLARVEERVAQEDPRIAQFQAQIEELRGALGGIRPADPRVDALHTGIEGLHRQMRELLAREREENPRITQLAEEVARLSGNLTEHVRRRPNEDERTAQLQRGVEQLRRELADLQRVARDGNPRFEELIREVGVLRGRVEEVARRPLPVDGRVEAVQATLEAVQRELAQLQTSGRDERARMDRLAQQNGGLIGSLHELRERLQALDGGAVRASEVRLRGELGALAERLEAVNREVAERIQANRREDRELTSAALTEETQRMRRLEGANEALVREIQNLRETIEGLSDQRQAQRGNDSYID